MWWVVLDLVMGPLSGMKGSGAGPAFDEMLIQVAKVMGPLLCLEEVRATGAASGMQETDGAAGGVG